MCSPVFSKALGECNAIRSWGFGPSELTFVSALETEFSASHACRSRTSRCTVGPHGVRTI